MTKSKKTAPAVNDPMSTETEEGFLKRWSRLKSESDSHTATSDLGLETPIKTPGERRINTSEEQADADITSLQSLHADSDYSVFFSSKVSEELRRLAFRKLFASSKFNLRDGLDDYDEDFRDFQALGDILTCDMRHRIERALDESQDAQDGDPQAELAKQTADDRLECDERGNGEQAVNLNDCTGEVATENVSPDDAAKS